jgi:hypothetical protein
MRYDWERIRRENRGHLKLAKTEARAGERGW